MGKLKSSMKSFQETITGLKPLSPNCILQGTTHSFREEDDLSFCFNYVYSIPSSASSSSSSLALSNLSESTSHLPSIDSLLPTQPYHMESLSSSLPKGPISSSRFFFSPSNTKSLMDEARAEMGHLKTPPLSDPEAERESFWEESVMMAMTSDDPYKDFKLSMQEMVEAYGIRELPLLQELLHCYLRLNERKNHKIIVLAYVDLLIDLVAQDKERFSDP